MGNVFESMGREKIMTKGTQFLDEAIDLARQEKVALDNGEYEKAIELAEMRTQVTGMAWNEYRAEEKGEYHQRLLTLSSLQEHLTGIASRAHEAIRKKLSRSRQEKRRMQGYQMAVGQALQ